MTNSIFSSDCVILAQIIIFPIAALYYTLPYAPHFDISSYIVNFLITYDEQSILYFINMLIQALLLLVLDNRRFGVPYCNSNFEVFNFGGFYTSRDAE